MIAPLDVSLALASADGFASITSACVLPLVPAFVAAAAVLGRAEPRSPGGAEHVGASVGSSAAFALGCAAGFAALFAASGTTGGGGALVSGGALVLFQRAGGLLLMLLGGYAALRRTPDRQRWGIAWIAAVSWMTGALFAAAWTPCVGPTLASILLVASLPSGAERGFLLLTVYALSLALPLAAGSVLITRALASLGRGTGLRFGPRLAGVLLALIGVAISAGRMTSVTGYLAQFDPLVQFGR